MEKAKQSSFQFKSHFFKKSIIDLSGGQTDNDFNVTIEPAGLINEKERTFQLHLKITAEDDEKTAKVEVEAVGNYTYTVGEEGHLNNFFFINAPAILFPYIRAYIGTLTNLSGIKPINLPTFNLTNLRDRLKEKTKTIA